MTIIVAVKTDEKIIIGADKRVTEDDTIVSEESSKILIKDLTIENSHTIKHEKFLIAFSGLYSLFELLKTFTVPLKNSNESFIEYLYDKFVPALNSYLQEYYFIRNYNNGQTGVEWELLLAYRNQLFRVEFNLGICEVTTPYYAIGAPRDIALGSLHTAMKKEKNPVEIFMVQNAIRACAAHNITCNNNMELYSIKSNGEINEINYTCTIK